MVLGMVNPVDLVWALGLNCVHRNIEKMIEPLLLLHGHDGLGGL